MTKPAIKRWPRLDRLRDAAEGACLRQCQAEIEAWETHLDAFLHVEQAPGKARADGPLAGIPMAVKDNIAVAGMPLTCASRVLQGYLPGYHATAVKRLIEAGACVVGKTNLDEFGMGSSTETSAYKITRNPHNLEYVPGGSSGGAAAAVGAGVVPFALGSDTGGSIRQPAAFCGIVGFKPSYGAVSRYGLVAYGSSLDQIGILSGHVDDAQTVFERIYGPDGRDGTVAEKADFERPNKDFSDLRFGVIRGFGPRAALQAPVEKALEEAAGQIAALGASVVELSLPALDETVVPAYYLTACAEAGSNLARYDAIRYGSRAGEDFDDCFKLISRSRNLFGPEVKLRILLGAYVLRAGHYEHFYGRAQTARVNIARDLKKAFSEVDFLLLPTWPTQPFKIGELIDDPVTMKLADQYTVPANLAGLPALSLPVGMADGLPTAVQILGPRFFDFPLLAVAKALEARLSFDKTYEWQPIELDGIQ